ncbi:uncharacterized protein J4E78_010311 [Alternaria triticimaculans]|uniref:uncharacterized protein n=1 Tax=Alternaria triticimaculans TaxID=297637 RepID=UPI0020C21932|nr:uncharacterized protein J4E78_010311 [Alternaria triticimaculans]KAI4641881.1 hypothetical protein J4E78_010311 [Alternaria triticimaculans]
MVVLTDSSPWKQAIALRNQRTSPLLKLPGEIRNTIYGYVLGHPVWYVGNSHEKRDAEGNVYEIFRLYEETQPGRHKPRASFGPSLLGVSRQIHLEAWPLFYSSSTFVVGNPRLFFFWIDSLPEVARLAVASVSLAKLALHGRVNGTSVDLDVSDALYPRTSFPPLDIHQIRQAPTLASSWEYNVLTSLGDVYWRLPGLKHLHLTVKVTYGEFQGFHAPYRRVEDQDIEAKVRSTVANVFALPNVHVDSDVLLYKR